MNMYYSDTELLVIGGTDGNTISNVEVYDIDVNLIQRLADLPTPR